MKILGFRIIRNDPSVTYPEDLEKKISNLNLQINAMTKEHSEKLAQLKELNDQIVVTDDLVLVQSYGLYESQYKLKSSEEYKTRLEKEREIQKDIIRNKQAVTGQTNWTVNNSKAEGNKLVNDVMKLLLRSFNSECEEATDKVRYSNFEQSEKRIQQAYTQITKLGRVFNMSISPQYYQSKIRELHLAFEYAQKKEEEKEELRLMREEARENAMLKREIAEARQKLSKEQTHYEKTLSALMKQLETAPADLKDEIVERIKSTTATIDEIHKGMEEVDYREANQRAGYVYIISNIGAFGPNVFKIGMSRRLDPEDRISELSDSSVPFDFDIHAMLFSDNAPKLETALHNRFANNKVNMVNPKREFFFATIEEIKDEIHKNYDKIVNFVDVPQAEQYRISQKMRELLQSNGTSK